MCGVFGYAKNDKLQDDRGTLYDLITELAISTEVRGRHATGYACRIDGQHVSNKKAVSAGKFVNTDFWTRFIDRMPESLIGHTRYATQGDPNDNRNNHPFQSRRYYLVHNGIIAPHEYKAYTGLCDSDCDSEAILRLLQVGNGVESGVARVFDSLPDSDFACLVMDKKTNKIHFFRTPDRPLRIWRSDSLILIGSTEEILENAFRHTIGVSSDRVKVFTKWTPRSGCLYTINPDLSLPETIELTSFPTDKYRRNIVDRYAEKNIHRFPYISGIGYPKTSEVSLDSDVKERAEKWGMVAYGD